MFDTILTFDMIGALGEDGNYYMALEEKRALGEDGNYYMALEEKKCKFDSCNSSHGSLIVRPCLVFRT